MGRSFQGWLQIQRNRIRTLLFSAPRMHRLRRNTAHQFRHWHGQTSAEVLEDRLLLFASDSEWLLTATDPFGTIGQGGQPTITWSIVADGTPMLAIKGTDNESSDDSDLVSFMNGLYGTVTADTNYTDEVWFQHIQSSFDRWSELSGVTFTYVTYDDGATFSDSAWDAPGVLGVRADIRIGGHRIDGNSNVVAYAFGPHHGEVVIDTADSYYSNLSNNSIKLRNTLTHELGHAMGLEHVSSGSTSILMEPFTNTAIDGPQLDDVLGIQRQFGDADEKLDNDTAGGSVSMGTLSSGGSVSRGIDASSMTVLPDTVGFISIDDEADVDYYSFTTTGSTTVDITLSPTGLTYSFGPQGGSESSYNAVAQQDLVLQLIGADGVTVLASADLTGAGSAETIASFSLPTAGTYYTRISGKTTDKIQLYTLTVADQAAPNPSLSLSIDPASVSEAAGAAAATGTVTRNNADVSGPLTVTLTSNDTGEATVPTTVVIPAGQSSATFDIAAVDDALVDGTQNATITASATGFSSDNATIAITDNDTLALTLTINLATVSESDGATAAVGTVSRNNADLSSALTVTLSSNDTGEATVPTTVVIPIGASSATFDIAAVDDAVVDGSQNTTITATATGYTSDNAAITVTDNDTLALSLSINPASVSEGAGATAAVGTVTRNSADLTGALTVTIASNDTSAATVPTTVVIPIGQSTATFDIAAVDDALVDGTQNATVTASATGFSSDNATIAVTDNDTLALTLTINLSSVSESDGATAAVGTVSRNNADLSSALTVNLASNDTGEATVPTTVVIPIGASSATFDIAAVDDALVDGSQNATITATATGYTSDNAAITVTDNDTLALSLSINLTSVSEGAGATAAVGTVSRNSEDLSSALTVTLSSNNTSAATVPTTVVIPIGQSSATFDIAAVDDALVDGTQSATITATATGYASANAALNVTDDDTLALSLSINRTTVSEADGVTASVGTVTRNDADLSSTLTVSLTSNDSSEATVPTTVVIPIGASSATFDIDAVDDALVDGSQVATITATATGYSSGNAGITVTDDDTLALTLTIDQASVSEADGATAAVGTVTRNDADLSGPLLVTLLSSNITAALVPVSVVIPIGASSATFDIAAVDDVLVDGSQTASITAAAVGYSADAAVITVTDDDGPTLSLTIDTASVTEGAGATAATGTVSRNNLLLTSPLTVTLTSSNTGAATVPTTVVIPIGASSVSFDIAAIDDELVDGTQNATISATATGYASDSAAIAVTDNDTLALTLTIEPGAVSEAAGASAATGTVIRNSADLSSALTVNLSSNNTGAATVPTTVVIPVGAASATFNIAAVDDALVDGDQNTIISAAAAGYSSDDTTIVITDNDTPALSVTINLSSVSEAAGAAAAIGTVSRNSADTSSALTVELVSSDTSAATVPSTVVIPVGASSTTFSIAAVDDAIVDGDQNAGITATAVGYASGSATLTVTDDDSAGSTPLTVGITRRDASSGNSGSYRFDVNFSAAALNVDSSDFVIVSTGSVTTNATVTVSDAGDGDPATWLITVTGVSGSGTLGLSLSLSTDIEGADSTPVTVTPTVTEVYQVVHDAYGLLDEAGRVPGNIAATVSGTSLQVTGDTADNAISIGTNAAGDIVVTGLNGTTINGQSQFVAFTGVSGVLPGDLRLTGSAGDDFFSVAGVSVTGAFFITTAGGRDAVSLAAITVGGDLQVRSTDVQLTHIAGATTGGHSLFFGGTGDDQIELNDLNVGGVLSATTGDGADVVVLNRIDAANSTQLTTGIGDDLIQMIDSVHHGSLYAATDAGDDELRASGITINATLYMAGGAGNDLVDFYNITTQSTAVISTAAGDDVVRLLHSEIAQAAYIRFTEGSNLMDLQDSFFGGTIEGQTDNGTLTTRLRRNTFTGAAQLLGGLGGSDVLLDDNTNVFHSVKNAARYEDTTNELLNEPFSRLTEYSLGNPLIDDRHGLGVRTGRTPGNVTATMQGSDLVITSDPGDNAFSVFANQAGDIVIRGRHGTTINGVTEFVALTGVAGVLPDDLKINGSAGDDLIEISGVAVTNDVFILTGDGVDGVLVSYVNTGRDLQVNTGNGAGYIDLEHSIQTRHTIVNSGNDADLAVISAMDIRSVFSVSTGAGADRVVMNNTTTTSSTTVNTGTGDDSVRLIGTNHDGTLYITSEGGNNVLTGNDVHVAQTFYVHLGVNNNSVQFLDSEFDSVGIIRFAAGQNVVDLQRNTFGGPTYLQALGGAMAARIRNSSFAGTTVLQGGPGSSPADVLMNDGSNTFTPAASITGFEDLSNSLIDELFEDLMGLAFV
ncbi:MAG: Calx-beta domain-containing protein [Fuerstiella sp.]